MHTSEANLWEIKNTIKTETDKLVCVCKTAPARTQDDVCNCNKIPKHTTIVSEAKSKLAIICNLPPGALLMFCVGDILRMSAGCTDGRSAVISNDSLVQR